jgi:hypothetical protein
LLPPSLPQAEKIKGKEKEIHKNCLHNLLRIYVYSRGPTSKPRMRMVPSYNHLWSAIPNKRKIKIRQKKESDK